MSSMTTYDDLNDDPEIQLRTIKNMLKECIQCNGHFERYRDGSHMAQAMRVSNEAPLKNILRSAASLANQNFPEDDKFELKLHLTAKQLRQLADLLE